jgi:uracil phosphoribosyltransferase
MAQLAEVVTVDDMAAHQALERMRDRSLPTDQFKMMSDVVARALAHHVGREWVSYQRRAVLVPILRAGLALEPAFRRTFPGALVHHIGLERDETTFKPRMYYPRHGLRRIPEDMLVIAMDPMNATGGSATFAIDQLYRAGANRVILINVIAADEGIARVQSEFAEVAIYTVALDPSLDANKFIVPGLGDYGDRYNGT